MAQQEHLYLLKRGITYWNQWRQQNPEILLDLSSANLKVANLSSVDLRGADLEGTIFDMTILDNAKRRRGLWNLFS